MRLVVLVIALGGCGFPTRSEAFACQVTTDCDSDRVCEQGFCVVGERPDASQSTPPDGSVSDAPPDADPFLAIAMQCTTAGYTLVAGPRGYYRSVNTGTSWVTAQADCADDVAGATHLIVLSTTAEVTFMKAELGWVGLSDRATEGTFVNVTNEANDQRPFASGQPDNGGGSEDCVQMKTAAGLDDDQCGNNHRYVCECDGHASTP